MTRFPKPGPSERHLVFTGGTAVAFALIWLSFPTQRYLSSSLAPFLCGAVVAVVAVDLIVAAAVTARVAVTASVERTEILTGEGVTVTLDLTGPPLPVSLRFGPSSVEVTADPATRGTVFVEPDSRGVVALLPLEVRSTGLCGVLGLLRRPPLPLPSPIYVGPRPLAPDRPFPELGGTAGDGAHLPSPTGDVVRGVRDYVPGDRRSLVHWRASARTGRLVVKEVEEPSTPVLLLVLDLGYGGAAGEAAAARAAWYLDEALRRRIPVVLASREAAGLRTGPVRSPTEVIRRLASAVYGPPTPGPGSASDPPPPWVTAAASATGSTSTSGGVGPPPPLAAGPASSWRSGSRSRQRVLRVGPDGDRWD